MESNLKIGFMKSTLASNLDNVFEYCVKINFILDWSGIFIFNFVVKFESEIVLKSNFMKSTWLQESMEVQTCLGVNFKSKLIMNLLIISLEVMKSMLALNLNSWSQFLIPRLGVIESIFKLNVKLRVNNCKFLIPVCFLCENHVEAGILEFWS